MARAHFLTFPTRDKALLGSNGYTHAFKNLNGVWKFMFLAAPEYSPEGFESTESKQETLSILDLFEDGSKEKALVKAWMTILGIIDCDDPESLPEKAFDRYIAKDILGYAGSSSNGYMRLRNKVRETLIKNGYKA